MTERFLAIFFGPSRCVEDADRRLAEAVEKLKSKKAIRQRVQKQLTVEIDSGLYDLVASTGKR